MRRRFNAENRDRLIHGAPRYAFEKPRASAPAKQNGLCIRRGKNLTVVRENVIAG